MKGVSRDLKEALKRSEEEGERGLGWVGKTKKRGLERAKRGFWGPKKGILVTKMGDCGGVMGSFLGRMEGL